MGRRTNEFKHCVLGGTSDVYLTRGFDRKYWSGLHRARTIACNQSHKDNA
jgi:hypothetical protein